MNVDPTTLENIKVTAMYNRVTKYWDSLYNVSYMKRSVSTSYNYPRENILYLLL